MPTFVRGLQLCSLAFFAAFGAIYLASALALLSPEVLRGASYLLFAGAITAAMLAGLFAFGLESDRTHPSGRRSALIMAGLIVAISGFAFGQWWGNVEHYATREHPAPAIPLAALAFVVSPVATLVCVAWGDRTARRAQSAVEPADR